MVITPPCRGGIPCSIHGWGVFREQHNIYIVASALNSMKLDLNGMERRHKDFIEEAKEEGIKGLTKANSDIIIQHIIAKRVRYIL